MYIKSGWDYISLGHEIPPQCPLNRCLILRSHSSFTDRSKGASHFCWVWVGGQSEAVGKVKVGHKSLCDLQENSENILCSFQTLLFVSSWVLSCLTGQQEPEKRPFCFRSAKRFVSKAFFLQSCFCRRSTNLAKHNFPFPFVLALLLIGCVTVFWSEVYVSTEGRDINDFVCSWSFNPAKQFNLGSFYL